MSTKYNINKTASDYIKEKDNKKLKTEILQLIEKKHGHVNIKKALNQHKLFDPIIKHDSHNRYASFLGRWSEYFIWTLKKHGVDTSDFFAQITEDAKTEDFQDSSNCTELSVFQSIQTFKNKTYIHRKNRSENWEKDLFKAGWPESLLKKDNIDFFKHVIIHFRDKVFPHTKHFQSNIDFFTSSTHKNVYECNIQGWEFDFFDLKNHMVVDFKFQQSKFDQSWFWQTLIYVYLLDFYYNVKSQGIKIINTFFGIEYSATLCELFGEQGVIDFFKICRASIPDKEKYTFQEQTKICYKEFFKTKSIDCEVVRKIFLIKDENTIKNLKNFVENLFTEPNNLGKNNVKKFQNIETKLRDVNWVWSKWTDFLQSF